jgi:hypothetical protein
MLESKAQTFTNEQAKEIFTILAQEKVITQSFKNQIITHIDEKNWDKLHYIEAFNLIPEEELSEVFIHRIVPDSGNFIFTKNNILRICLDNYRQKGEKTQGGWVVYPPLSVKPEQIIDNQIITKKSSLNKSKTTKLLSILKNTQLINNQAYNDALSNNYSTFSEAVRFVIERNIFYDTYPIIKQQQVNVLADLQKKDFLSEANYKKYINTYQNYELHNWIDILADCKNALVIDYQNFPKEPIEYYQQLFKKVKEILPEFDYKNLEIKTQEVDIDTYQYISTKIQDIEYQQHIVFTLYYQSSPANELSSYMNKENELELVNDFLRDRDDARRFYWVRPFQFSQFNPPKAGLILLDSSQTDVFGEFISPDKKEIKVSHFFDSSFKRKSLQEKIKTYISKNIIRQLPDNELDSLITGIIRDKPKHLFNHLPFPKFYPFNYEYDSTNQINISLSIQKKFMEIINVIQSLIQINEYKLEKLPNLQKSIDSDEFAQEELEFYNLKVNHSNKIFEINGSLSVLIGGLPNLMNQIMENNHIKAKFFELGSGEWLYLNEKQLNYLRENEPEVFKYLKD